VRRKKEQYQLHVWDIARFNAKINNHNYQNEKCAVPDLTSILPPQEGLEFPGSLGVL